MPSKKQFKGRMAYVGSGRQGSCRGRGCLIAVRKRRKMNTDAQLTFSFSIVSDPSPWNGATYIKAGSLLSSTSLEMSLQM